MPTDNSGNGCLVSIAFILGLFVFGMLAYTGLDSAGWISHDHTVDLYMKGDWLVGENRICTGTQNVNEKHVPEVDAIFCPFDVSGGTSHNMTIKFWGKISRPDAITNPRLLGWECTRHSDGFTCKAFN
jgi:hypothetical protein